MDKKEAWLPDLVSFSDYGGDWHKYLDALYKYFKADFIDRKPVYEGRRLGLKRRPMSQGKEATFWHMIQEGAVEEDRVPDFRRCERIRWPHPIIENSSNTVIKVWKNERKGEDRICLWLESEEYIVILADRGDYILPWTAYMVDRPHNKRKLQKEYERYWKNRS
ncbi:MAG: hypothetical protein OEV42_07165 [Deltaproteobacteria bacterium]|nr:hypothetical protein [Deltaproteobacteria bacterium]